MRAWWPAVAGPHPAAGDPASPWPDVIEDLQGAAGLAAAGEWALGHGQVDLAMALAGGMLERRRDATTLLVACRIAYQAARLPEAAEWARALRSGGPVDEGARRLVDEVEARCALLDRLAQPRREAAVQPVPRRVVAMLAYSLPYVSNGYATRSHGLLGATQEVGWDVRPFTRPGYPGDADSRWGDATLPDQDVIDTLHYGRLQTASRRRLGHTPYLMAAADEIARMLAEVRPQLVHAASNYTTALPACLAAREAGLPFVYEVRGFWDVTRVSSDPVFDRSAEYRYLRLFERAVLGQADAVVTLTEAMKAELVRRGAPADRIEVAPNAVDAAQFEPVPRDAALAAGLGVPEGVPVIGYAGSFVDYEGLDDLVEACSILRRDGRRFHLLLVGDGRTWADVSRQVMDAGLQDWATLPGRVPHDQIAAHYALMDLCPFPRKPWPVCELVSPLKPFEAMALGKPVLVSSVAAMAESVHEGVNGWVFEKGEPARLAAALARGLDDPEAARALGQRARAWVREERHWRASAAAVERAYALAMAHHARRG